MLCSCPPGELCATCREQQWLRAKGTVACRGENWVELRRTLPLQADALRGVADLASDPVLRERLAAEWMRYARLRWHRWRLDPEDWLRRV